MKHYRAIYWVEYALVNPNNPYMLYDCRKCNYDRICPKKKKLILCLTFIIIYGIYRIINIHL